VVAGGSFVLPGTRNFSAQQVSIILAGNIEKRKWVFGYFPEFWGRGILQEVLPVICNYAFTKWNLHRIEAYVETENSNSANVLIKQAFTHEGTMIDSEVKDGKFISVALFAKLKSK
jgi:ribosomal-protein-alanine N-acetyltransferase